MKREIKFKIYNPLRKSMHIPCKIAINLNGKVFPDCDNWRDFTEECEQLILMQYTGLQDKNGKEIYEGDIMEWDNEKNLQYPGTYVGQVQYIQSHAMFDLVIKKTCFHNEHLYFINEKSKIIGNIYENPELLDK